MKAYDNKRRLVGIIWSSLVALYIVIVIIAALRPEFGSDATARLITRLLPTLSQQSIVLMTTFVRRAIHLIGYALLAVFLFNALISTRARPDLRRTRRRFAVYAVLIALSVAAFDETLQMRFPARHGRFQDVLIDLVGIFVGVILRVRQH